MHVAKLSTKGEIQIPQSVRSAHHWVAGTELELVDTADGVLLKPKRAVAATKLEEVAGCLGFEGKARTLEEMDQAIAEGVRESRR